MMEILILRNIPGDHPTAAIRLSPTEFQALAAAGRAAGISDETSTLEAVINDALDVGFRKLREQQDREALGFGVQAA